MSRMNDNQEADLENKTILEDKNESQVISVRKEKRLELYYLARSLYMGYRKKIVMDNLAIAFPGKTVLERKAIAKQFYKNLVDTFL